MSAAIDISLTLTVELGLLQRFDLADVDVLHRVDALHRLEDRQRDVLGDAAKQSKPTQNQKKDEAKQGARGAEKKPKINICSSKRKQVGTPYFTCPGFQKFSAVRLRCVRTCSRCETAVSIGVILVRHKVISSKIS